MKKFKSMLKICKKKIYSFEGRNTSEMRRQKKTQETEEKGVTGRIK